MDPLLKDISESSEPHRFRRKSNLVRRKLAEYIPVMIITNLSLLLINSVDQIVAGNYIGKAAMASISIFYPLTLVIAVFSGPVASGISTAISNAQGKNDLDGIKHSRSAGRHIMITVSIAISIIQIPIMFFLISTYDLSAETTQMVRQYAIGMMICTPLGIVSTVGTYLLQIAGKMKILMALSIIEGVANLAFDLLFVGGMDMGVAGAGFGSAAANFIRASLTVLFLKKYTSFFKSSDKGVTLQDYKSILSLGLPDAAFMLMVAFQNYFTLRVVLLAFGDDGGAIYGLCSFCLNVVNIILFGTQSSMRPLMGLYTGGGDLQGIRILMRRGMLVMITGAGLFTSIVILHPDIFYHIHGIKDIPAGGLLSVQIYSIFFVIRGSNHIFRLYFSNEKDIKFATTLTVIGNATLPLFALVLYYMNVPDPYIFFSYTITELIILAPSILRYKYLRKRNRQNETDDIVLYMTVEKEQAVDASRYIREFAKAHDIDERPAYRVALCMEEMVAFIEDSATSLHIPHSHHYVDIVIRFKDKSNVIFTTLDDGAFIDMESSTEMQELVTDNYGLIKRMATSIKYEYILNLNYTIITI